MVGPLSAALTLAALLLPSAQQDAPADASADETVRWSEAWSEAEALAGEPDSAARVRRGEVLLERARAAGADPRARLLAALVHRALDASWGPPTLEPEELAGLDAEGCRLAVGVLAPGPALDAALLRALAELPDDRVAEVYRAGFDRFVALDSAYRAEQALALVEALHARARAGWSASNLATVLRRLGRTERAAAVLSGQLERAADRAEEVGLLQDRALVWLGAGQPGRARADLGAAIARGSPDAGVVLGRQALSEGRPERARTVLRGLAEGEPPQAWALRGWGLSMLPTVRGRL